jgi:SAM-dependent methyltransferase
MDNENTSIHEFDINLICEYFSSLERQGPGSPEITLKALNFIDNLSADSHIVDLGCGTGGQTMTLARNTSCKITGLDLFPAFIDLFNENAAKLQLSERVKGIVGSMDDLPFEKESLDLVWSEGAIYNIGFNKGVSEWRDFLKQGAYIAVTDASWFTNHRPDEIQEFWMEHYPEIDTIPNKVLQLQNAGYIPVATFVLPQNCWTEHFYAPQAKAQDLFLKKHKGNPTAENYIAFERYEMNMYQRFKEYYGYVFYIGKKL